MSRRHGQELTNRQREINATDREIDQLAYESAILANARTLTLPGEDDAPELSV